jgi:hypothetical protein
MRNASVSFVALLLVVTASCTSVGDDAVGASDLLVASTVGEVGQALPGGRKDTPW